MARQGKCAPCKVRYEWKRELALARLRCPACKGPIRATTYQWGGKTVQQEPLVVPPGYTERTPQEKWFTMRLESVGNPDFNQYAPVSNPETVYGSSLKEMRDKALAYIRRWNLGGGNWMNPKVVNGAGQIVAYISYNGRVWKHDPCQVKDAEEIAIVG